MFIGGDLEFNANAKYIYIDRLYRVIGRDERAHAAQGRAMAMLAVAFVFGPCLLCLAGRLL